MQARNERMLRRVPAVCGAIATAIGGTVLVLWLVAVPVLVELGPIFLMMKANTSLAIASLGVALLVRAGRPPGPLLYALCTVPVAVGLLTIAEHTGLPVAIDELLARDPSLGSAAPGRPPLQGAIAFVCLGAAIATRRPRVRHVLCGIAAAIAGIAIVSYLYDAPLLRRGLPNDVALPAAIGLIAVALGTSMLEWESTWLRMLARDSHGGRALRRLVPLALTVPAIVGSILWEVLGGGSRSLAIAMLTLSTSGVLAAAIVRWAVAIEQADHAKSEALAAEKRARRMAEELVREREHELELRELFVGVLGHDLRNPLGAVRMAAQVGTARASGEGERRLFERIVTSSGRMARMIEQILDMTRARLGGTIVLERRPTDLRALVEEIAAELRDAAPDARIEVRGVASLTAEADVDRIAQVISNLIGNAVTHGAPARPITVEVGRDGDHAVVAITNEGPPIAAEVRESMFDPFVRSSERSERASGGLGLGLYISHEIVRAHGGTIDVTSDAMHTTFRVRVPLAARAGAEERRPAPSRTMEQWSGASPWWSSRSSRSPSR